MGDGPAADPYRRPFEAILDAAVVLDATTGLILAANQAATKIFGFGSPNEMVGLNPLDYVAEEDRQPVALLMAQGLQVDRPPPAEIRMRTKDGRAIWVSATSTLIEHEGKKASLTAIREITSEKATDAALKEAEHQYQSLFDGMLDGAVVLDVSSFQIVLANKAAADMFGFASPREAVGENPLSYIPEEDRDGVARLIALNLEGKATNPAELRVLTTDKKERWISATATKVDYEGRTAILSTLRDLTSEKAKDAALRAAEETLKASEERFRTLIEKATDVVIVLDASGKITYQSPSLERVTGFGHDEWLNKPLGELLIHPDDMPALAALLQRILTQPGATVEGVSVRYQHKDRSWHTLEATVTNMLHDPKVNGLVANFRDITDRKTAEEALKRSEALLRDTQELASIGGWEYDVERKEAHWTDETYRIHEIPKIPTIDHITESLKCYPPPERQTVARAFQKCLEEGVPYDLELPFVTFTGKQRWVRTSAKAVREGDRIVRVLGNIADITGRKRTEDALQSSEERNRTIVENANEAVTVIQDGLVKFINPKFSAATGYAAEEVLLKPFSDFVHPDDRQMLADYYIRRQKGEEVPTTHQFRFLDKAGNTKWAEINAALFEWEGRLSTLGIMSDITERKLAGEALREAKEYAENVIRTANVLVVMLDTEGKVTLLNEAGEKVTGYQQSEVLGKNWFELIVPKERYPNVWEEFTKLKASGAIVDTFENPMLTKSGEERIIAWKNSTLVANDNVVGTLSFGMDITEAKKARDSLKQSEAKYKRLFESTQTAMEVISMETGLVVLANEATASMFGFASADDLIGEDSMKYLRPEDVGWVSTKMAQAVTDNTWQEIAELQVRTKDGRWLWISGMAVQSEYQGKPALLVSLLDITRRKQAEQTLQESEEKYRFLTERTNDVIYTTDLDFNDTYVSPSVERILGFTPEEHLARSPDQRMTLESLARAQEALLEHLSMEKDPKADPNRTVRIELEFYHKDGSTVWLEHQVSALRDANGTAIGLHGVARDVAERRKTEQALRASEEKYRLLTEKTNDVIWTTGLDLRTNYISPSVERILGFTPEHTSGQDVAEQMTPESVARAKEALARHLALEQDPNSDPSRNLRIELEYYHKDGSTVWLENQVSGIRDASGKLVGFHGVARDITERRKAEQALKESERKYRVLAENTNDLIWMADLDMRPTYMSPSTERIMGFTPEESLKRELADNTTPESLAKAQEALLHHLLMEKDPSADPNRTLILELEFYRKDGSTVWLEQHVSGIRDADGTLVGFHGVARDVTERKRAEQSLKERLKELQCIAGVTRLAEKPELPIEDFVREAVGLLPAAWQYPDICVARIQLDSKEFKTAKYHETEWSQSADIRVDEKRFGTVTVCYLQEMPEADEGPFLKEERTLIDTIADFLGHVVQHRQMEQHLRASEERYRLLAQNASDIIWVIDANLKITYISPSATGLLGYSVEELMTGSFERALTPESLARVAQVYMDDMVTEKSTPGSTGQRIVEIEVVRKDGATVWLEAVTNPTRDADGRLSGFQGACRDVTKRRRAQEALATSETNYRNLFHQTLLGMEVVDGQTGKVMLANHAIARMFGFNSPEEMVGLDAITGWVLPEDMEWVLREFAKAMADPEKRDVATLRVRGKDGRMLWVSGSGTLFDYEGRPAILISLIDVTTAREAEGKLRESEEKNRLLVENAAEGIAVIQDGMAKFFNRRLVDLTGWTDEDLLTRSFLDLVHPDEREMIALNYMRRVAGEDVPNNYVFRIIDNEGNTKWLQVSAVQFDWGGKPATLTMFSEVTERVKAEQALRDSEERFRSLVEKATDAVAVLDAAGNIRYYTPSMERVTGYRPGEWVDKSLSDLLLHPDDLPKLASVLEQVLKEPGASVENFTTRYQHRDGTWHVLEATARNMLHDPKINGIVANFRDITERVKAEEKLKESEGRYRLLAENATDVIWVADLNLRLTYASPAVTRLLGYTMEEVAAGSFLNEALTPDSLSSIAQVFAEDLAAEDSRPGSWRERTVEIEVVSKDGSKYWLEAAISGIRDAAGRLIEFQGACRNITDRKKAEESLRSSEERFRGLVETTSDWVWEIDRNSRYTYVSPRVREILGREPEEMLDHTPFEFMHQREGRRVSKILRRFSAEHLPFSLLENTCTHKDGHSVILETSAVPIIGSDGSFLGYRGIDRDITERKKVEQELQHSLKRLGRTMESTIEAITTTIETRDPYTTGHQVRVTDLACAIAKVMEVPPTQIEGIRVAGLLHDIGKIAIPTEILSKPGKLNEVEYEMIKTHAKVGYNILKKIEFPWPVARAVLQHHERWNGSGYPHGIRGEDILLEARILAVADVMEAMSSHRPYRPSIGAEKALDEIAKNSGVLYDPAVADACITAFTRAGFKFASSPLGVAGEHEATSASHPVQYLKDQ